MTDKKENGTAWMSESAQAGPPRIASHIRLPTASWFSNHHDDSVAVATAAYRTNTLSAAVQASTGMTEPPLPPWTAPNLFLQTVVVLGTRTLE